MKTTREKPMLSEVVHHCNVQAWEAIKHLPPGWERVRAFGVAWAEANRKYLKNNITPGKEVNHDR